MKRAKDKGNKANDVRKKARSKQTILVNRESDFGRSDSESHFKLLDWCFLLDYIWEKGFFKLLCDAAFAGKCLG